MFTKKYFCTFFTLFFTVSLGGLVFGLDCPDVTGTWDVSINRIVCTTSTEPFLFDHEKVQVTYNIEMQDKCLFWGKRIMNDTPTAPITGVISHGNCLLCWDLDWIVGNLSNKGTLSGFDWNSKQFTRIKFVQKAPILAGEGLAKKR